MKKIFGDKYLILLALFSLLISWPLMRSGYFSHQDDLHVIRIYEMRQCFNDLQIPCRWVSNMGWGNGLPLFNFYGVSTYYGGAIISLFTGFLTASKILFFMTLSVGSFGIYLLVKELWGKNAGFVSAILYMFAPYKALDIYVRGALVEAMALAIIPFVFYFFLKLIIANKNRKYFIYSTLSLFVFLITHNIMTVIFVPVLIAWIAFWIYTNNYKNFKLTIYAILVAFGLSSFFIVPAFFEKSLVQTESLTRFELDYRANFVSLKQIFIDRSWGYGTSIPGPEGTMSFQVGLVHWLLSVVVFLLIFFIKKDLKNKVLVLLMFAVFVLSLFMMHNKSAFVWENIGILTYFQFPWRFLSLSIFASSILVGFIASLFSEKWNKLIALLIVIVTVVLNFNYFKPREFYDITESQKLSGELWDMQTKGALLDYLPKTALEPREAATTEPLIISGQAIVENYIEKSNSFEFDVKVSEKSEIHLPIFYFLEWEIKVNGQAYEFEYDNLLGRIEINLPQGEYNVYGKFKNTLVRNLANSLTLLSTVLFFVILKKNKK